MLACNVLGDGFNTLETCPSINIDCRIDGETLKSFASHWPPQRWQEYEPLLSYCRDNGIRLIACGTPLEVIMLSFEVMFRVSGKISVRLQLYRLSI